MKKSTHHALRLKPTLKELQLLCEEWQARLRLRDWAVLVKLNPKLPGAGRILPRVALGKTAILQLNPDVAELRAEGCLDLEVTIVHELIHIYTSGYDDFREETLDLQRVKTSAHECMVETLAQVLVGLKRGVAVNRMTCGTDVDEKWTRQLAMDWAADQLKPTAEPNTDTREAKP